MTVALFHANWLPQRKEELDRGGDDEHQPDYIKLSDGVLQDHSTVGLNNLVWDMGENNQEGPPIGRLI